MMFGLIWPLIFLASTLSNWWLDRRFACTCGRKAVWYYASRHESAWLMLTRALLCTTAAVAVLITVDWTVLFLAVLAYWLWRRWWRHEKDRLKRKAARLAGRVTLNQHGRLVVSHQ